MTLGLRSLLKTSMLVVGARVAGAAVGFASQVLLARLVGAQSLGIFFLSISLATVLSIVCTLGYPWIIAPIVAKSEAERRPHFLASFLAFARREMVLASIVLVSLVILILAGFSAYSLPERIALALGALIAPLFVLMRMNGALANAYKIFPLAYLPDLFFRPFLFFAFVGVLWIFSTPLSVPYLVTAQLTIVLILVVFQAQRLRNIRTHDLHATRIQPTPEPGVSTQRSDWRRQALPMVLAMLFIGGFSDLALVVSGTLLMPAQTAVFGAGIKIAMFLAFAIQAIHQIIWRDAADALHSNDHAELNKLLGKTNLISIAISIAALAVVLAFGHELLALFGSAFTEGYVSLIIVMVAQTVRAAAGPALQILTITGQTRAGLPVFAVSLALLPLLNLLLTPTHGLNGAALSLAVSTLVWSLGLALITRKITGVNVAII